MEVKNKTKKLRNEYIKKRVQRRAIYLRTVMSIITREKKGTKAKEKKKGSCKVVRLTEMLRVYRKRE